MPRRAVLVVASFLAGCDDTEFPPPYITYDPTWEGVQAFTYEFCRECHFADDYGALPDILLPGVSYTTHCEIDMCDVPLPDTCADEEITCEMCAVELCTLVVPNDPSRSLFWRVLSDADRNPGELSMPPTGSLPASQVQFVYDWIIAGAPQ